MSKNCLIIGAGAVGIVTAYSLAYNKRSKVSIVVRSDYDKITKDGILLDSSEYGVIEGWRPNKVYRDTRSVKEDGEFYDYVIVSMKSIPDVKFEETLSYVLQPVLDSNREISPDRLTSVMLIQNGIGIEMSVADHFDKQKYNYVLLSGVQKISATKVAPGHVLQQSLDNLTVGPFDQSDAVAIKSAQEFIEIYSNEKLNLVIFDDDVKASRWRKLLYNAVISPVSTLVALDAMRLFKFGEYENSTEENIIRPAMREVIAVAKSEGVTIEESLCDRFIDSAKTLTFKPSMCVDAENGRLMELEVLLGNPVRIAKKNGVPVPMLSLFYHLLMLLQNKIKESKGMIAIDQNGRIG
ncbi:HDL249Cp [Eremothecium sinecaudum]|uniref:HDL249Cp n=1 Tax=Eremothecium sinecaudum TaxID=45286 RepID=A0A0X8HS95_9SACH|nr:HDL249Cp [Eremothecium sinecaudum]AMD20495.1 HDL249Cp [Eremothecium sinecaudum]